MRARSSCRLRATGSFGRVFSSVVTSDIDVERARSTSSTRADSASRPARSSASSRSCSRVWRSRSSSAARLSSLRLSLRSGPMSWVSSAMPPESGQLTNCASARPGNVNEAGSSGLMRSTTSGRSGSATCVLRKRLPSRETILRSNGRLSKTLLNDRVEGMSPRSRQSSSTTMTRMP